MGYGFLVDEKGGRLYLNQHAVHIEKPGSSLGTFKSSGSHSLSADSGVREFMKQNPCLDEVLAASPDGKWVATGTHLYSATTFTVHKELPLPSTLVAFSKDSGSVYYFDWVNRVIARLDLEGR